jgi:NitT/TauT family transport system substrate-binding protein
MRSVIRILVAAALGALVPAVASGQGQPVPINVSYQPALYWSVPYYIASERGWWQEAGLKPSFSTFPSGAPQVAAAASKSWDVGGMGSAPATLGAVRVGLVTIGITNDESAGNLIMARGAEADAILKNPVSLKGKQLLLTTNSTGEYASLACLKKLGLERTDMQVVNLNQAEIISAFSSGNGTLAGVWAPNNYTLEQRTGARTVCTGKDAGAVVPGTLVVRGDYAREHPDLVARYLAVYLRSVAWQKKHPKETVEYMKKFYSQGGVLLPDKYLQTEIDTRPTFTLDEQLRILDRAKGTSQADQWYGKLGEYLTATGTIASPPDPKTFITDEYMKRVAADPKLRAFASGE